MEGDDRKTEKLKDLTSELRTAITKLNTLKFTVPIDWMLTNNPSLALLHSEEKKD